jgi:hypothetical protein
VRRVLRNTSSLEEAAFVLKINPSTLYLKQKSVLVFDRRNPPQATRLQPAVRRVYPEGLEPVHIAFTICLRTIDMKDKKIA